MVIWVVRVVRMWLISMVSRSRALFILVWAFRLQPCGVCGGYFFNNKGPQLLSLCVCKALLVIRWQRQI